MYTLYHHPYSQHCRRVVSLLEAAEIPYQLVFIDLGKGGHMAPEFLAINPNHQVPTLINGDVKIHESNAILRYLCLRHGLTDWYPEDIAQRAMIEQWLDWNQSRLSAHVIGVVFNTLFAGDNGDADAIRRSQKGLDDALPVLEAGLAKAPYLAGENPTIADLSVASNIFHLGMAKAAPETPNIQAWFARISDLEAFRKSLPSPPG